MTPSEAAPQPGWARPVAWLLAAAVFGWLTAGALGRAQHMLWPFGIDSAYFLQRAWLGWEEPLGRRTLLTNEIGRGAFGGRHHSPLIGLFVPAAAMFRSYASLLVAQAAIVALGVLPLFALCWRSSRDRVLALVLLLAALSAPGFLEIPVLDFRLITPALVLVPVAIGAAVFGGWPLVFAATVAACGAREGCAPLLLSCVPWLMWERSRRLPEERRSWLLVLLAVGLPAAAWWVGTEWRAGLFPGHRGILVDQDLSVGVPAWAFELFASDLRGERGDPPILIARILRVAGAAALLIALRPLALLPFALYWAAASLHSGMINPHQVHYYAPLVGVAVALVPLALTGPRPWPRGARIGGGLVVLGVNLLVPWYAAGPVDTVEAARRVLQEPIPEAGLAVEHVGPGDRVVASDWLVPTIEARATVWSTADRGGIFVTSYDDIDVVLLSVGDGFEPEVRAAGFVEVARTDGAIVLRRPD